ncbi:methylmalonyl-CoA mutase family protein [bacterium]|nr:methylmalonyl-CoA mutase family protein [bacterium]
MPKAYGNVEIKGEKAIFHNKWIAAGANPISQLAFTLANGFTYVEYYLSRGMDINKFGPNLSFFFSNGIDWNHFLEIW